MARQDDHDKGRKFFGREASEGGEKSKKSREPSNYELLSEVEKAAWETNNDDLYESVAGGLLDRVFGKGWRGKNG